MSTPRYFLGDCPVVGTEAEGSRTGAGVERWSPAVPASCARAALVWFDSTTGRAVVTRD